MTQEVLTRISYGLSDIYNLNTTGQVVFVVFGGIGWDVW